jgi:hypothetical protein
VLFAAPWLRLSNLLSAWRVGCGDAEGRAPVPLSFGFLFGLGAGLPHAMRRGRRTGGRATQPHAHCCVDDAQLSLLHVFLPAAQRAGPSNRDHRCQAISGEPPSAEQSQRRKRTGPLFLSAWGAAISSVGAERFTSFCRGTAHSRPRYDGPADRREKRRGGEPRDGGGGTHNPTPLLPFALCPSLPFGPTVPEANPRPWAPTPLEPTTIPHQRTHAPVSEHIHVLTPCLPSSTSS